MLSDNFSFGYFCRAGSEIIADLLATNIPWKYGGLPADRWHKQFKERFLYPTTDILLWMQQSPNFNHKPLEIAQKLAQQPGPLAYGAK